MSIDTNQPANDSAVVDEEAMENQAKAIERRASVKQMVVTLFEEAGERQQSDDYVMDIVEGILNAETLDDIFEAQEAGGLSSKAYVNQPFRLKPEGLQFLKSTIVSPSSLPFYAALNVTEIGTGEERNITAGGNSVVPVLYKLREAGFLKQYADEYGEGMPLVFVAKGTAAGLERLELRPYKVAKPAKKASASR